MAIRTNNMYAPTAAPGFNIGPAGSSGGMTGGPADWWGAQAQGGQPNPYPPGYIGPNGQQMNPQQQGAGQYGYGTAPGQSGLGYYEQQTPAGSFAAAENPWMQPQQRATAQGYENRYLGATTPGVSAAPSVIGYAQGAQYNSPWLGGSSGQVATPGANAYAADNPELGRVIDAASQDALRNFNLGVRPALDSADRASGSFGNSALSELRGTAYSDLGKQLGNIASGIRYQDYTRRGDLTEAGLNRGLQAEMANLGARSGDLSRNLAGSLQQQGLNSGQLLDAAKFDASNVFGAGALNANLAAGDIGRNANLANAQGQFGAGAQNAASLFNAGQGNTLAQYFGNLMQQNRQFNAGNANSMLEAFRNRQQNQSQFDTTFDFGVDRENWNRERTGQQDQINLLGQLLGWNQQGVGNATAIQNTPLQYLQQFAGIGQGLGGLGGTNSQQLQGNPALAALGAWLATQGLSGG